MSNSRNIVNELTNAPYAPISFQYGFNLLTPELQLPASHRLWDEIAKRLPDYLATFAIRDTMMNMPVLSANIENLPEKYLTRASIVVSAFAHAYYYPNGYASNDPLPDAIRIPLEEIGARIGKKTRHLPGITDYVGRTCWEDFIANWQYIPSVLSSPALTIENTTLLIPYFNMPEEIVSTLVTGPLMQASFAPALEQISRLEDELSLERPNKDNIIMMLNLITTAIQASTEIFKLLNPVLGRHTFSDQVLWAKTGPTMGKKSHPNEAPNTGADSPIFHIMDELIYRTDKASKMGVHASARFNVLPTNYQRYISMIQPLGKQLFHFIQSENDTTLNNSFAKMVNTYAGNDGLLGKHRKKAYGYLKFAYLAGRVRTNNNEFGQANTGIKPWDTLNTHFLESLAERTSVLSKLMIQPPPSTRISTSSTPTQPTPTKRFRRYQIAAHNKPDDLYVIYEGKVFDFTKMVLWHPGGHKIIFSSAGTDISTTLKHAHASDLDKIVAMMNKYHIGDIIEDDIPTDAALFFDKWTSILFTLSDTQNNLTNIWQFDQDKAFDGKRDLPFYLLNNVLDVFFSIDGYFYYFISLIDTDLLASYCARPLHHFRSYKESATKYLFPDLGKLAAEYGMDEIKDNNFTDAVETHIRKLGIYHLYCKLINDSLHFLDDIKRYLIDTLTQKDNATQALISDKQITATLTEMVINYLTCIDSQENVAIVNSLYKLDNAS